MTVTIGITRTTTCIRSGTASVSKTEESLQKSERSKQLSKPVSNGSLKPNFVRPLTKTSKSKSQRNNDVLGEETEKLREKLSELSDKFKTVLQKHDILKKKVENRVVLLTPQEFDIEILIIDRSQNGPLM